MSYTIVEQFGLEVRVEISSVLLKTWTKLVNFPLQCNRLLKKLCGSCDLC